MPALSASNAKPVYVDCNAVSPPTTERVAAAIAPTGRRSSMPASSAPAAAGRRRPALLRLRPHAPRFATLKQYGLDVRVLEGPLTAASALKMSYAGITKGTQALAAVMMLAASRGGSADALFAELIREPAADAGLAQAPAHDHAAEGLPLGRRDARDRQFRRRGSAGHELYSGAAHFYEQVARDSDGDKEGVAALEAFLSKGAAS